MADDTLLPSRQIVQAGRRHNSTRIIDRQEGPSTSASTWRGGLDAQARLLGLQPANGQHLQGLRHSKPILRTGLAAGTWENRLRAAWIEMIEGGWGRGDGNIPQSSRLSYQRVNGKQYQLLTCTDKAYVGHLQCPTVVQKGSSILGGLGINSLPRLIRAQGHSVSLVWDDVRAPAVLLAPLSKRLAQNSNFKACFMIVLNCFFLPYFYDEFPSKKYWSVTFDILHWLGILTF